MLLFLKVKWFLYREERKVRREFSSFLPYEQALKRAYHFQNPFRICRDFMRQQKEKNPHVYGETPLPIFDRIAKRCKIQSHDVIFEIGCGRGRGAMFLSHLYGCKVVGIDWVPTFIDIAKAIAAEIDPPIPLAFRCEDMLLADYSGATVIYLYGTCLSDQQVLSLAAHFEKLPPSTKIVTVSYPLTDYSDRFRVVDRFSESFPWGEGEIFFNQLIN